MLVIQAANTDCSIVLAMQKNNQHVKMQRPYLFRSYKFVDKQATAVTSQPGRGHRSHQDRGSLSSNFSSAGLFQMR